MAKTVQEKPDRRKTPVRRKAAATTAPASVSDDTVARRAFEVYCARGGGHGQDVDDWLQAERELRATDNQRAG